MALLDLTATTDDARASTSISALGTAARIVVKVRLNGACLLSPAAYARRIIWEIGSLAGTLRCNLRIYHDPDTGPNVDIRLLNNGGSSVVMSYARGSIVSGNYYIIYTGVGTSGGWDLELYDSDGNSLASNTNADTSLGGSGAGNGKLGVGQGVDTAATTDSVVGYVDGIAVYSASLTGGDRWGAPSSGDANLLSFVGFDEGSGTTAADVATGGSDLTLSGAGWQTGGTWNGTTTGVGRLVNGGLIPW